MNLPFRNFFLIVAKRLTALLVLALFAIAIPARADYTVVFNEIMYHPATNEPVMEWVELYNQMAVDMEISGWSLDGDIQYTFPSNTIVHGGAFVVVAISPTNLAAVTGLTNIFGPFTNRLSNSGGTLLLRDNDGRVVNEVDYDTKNDWPVAPDGSGVSLAKFDHGTGSGISSNWTFSAQMGGTPGKENFPVALTNVPVAFNEVSTPTNTGFFVELINYGTNSLVLDGAVLQLRGSTNAEYILPGGTTLPAHGFLNLTNTTLGFLPVSGDDLFLLSAARTNVLDAVVMKSGARARFPDGTGPWLVPATATPGASNNVVLHGEIVINEIMYHHQLWPATNGLTPQANPEEWIELYNRSNYTVNLTGWQLDGGISFAFPAGKTLAAGSYLVVARDSATLRTIYPTIDIVGDYSGKLSHSGDTIILEDPTGNPANSVRYYTSGHWPEFADGGGSSMELRDVTADNTKAEAWAASDESGKSSWQTYSYQAVANTVVGPETWNNFITGLITEGECLIDDISVIQSPTSTPLQFISNGNFENGSTGWRFLGNHMTSRVEVDSSNTTNHVLHLIATGPEEDLHNHIEATYTAGRKVTNGLTYQISYRAKWLAGNNQLNTRLYYDRASKTMALPAPMLNGTPGAQNSRYATNIGPTFSQFKHRAVIPAVNQAVTVSAVVQDPQGVSTCEVWWSTNGGAFSHATMTTQTNNLYTGTIPGFPAATTVQFFVRAVDALGAVATFPAGNSNAAALYTVTDGQANLNLGHNMRVILTPANWKLMRDLSSPTNLMSDAFLPCTLIYDEQRAYYDIGARLKGSQSGRWYDLLPGFHLEFQPDDLFRGEHPSILINTSGRGLGSGNKQEDILVHHAANHAGGLPDVQRDMARMIAPGGTNTGPSTLLPRNEDQFISTAFPNGNDGTEWTMELTYYGTSTNSQGYILPNPQLQVGPDISDLGTDKETYRYNFIIKNHRSEDDYTRFIPFAQTFSLSSASVLNAQANQVLDMNEWLRTFAFVSLMGESDWYTFGPRHNLLMYMRPSDNRMVAFLWDLEHETEQSASNPLIGTENWSRIASVAVNKRRLYAHALDIISSTYNTNYMTYWAKHYATFAPGQDYSDLLNYIPARVSAVNSEINTAGGNTAFSLTSATNVSTSSNLVTLTGTAPVQVQSILVNGIAYAVTWSNISTWSIRVPVTAVSNVLSLTAYDLKGNPLTNDSRTITVNYSQTPQSPIGAIVINEIQYNPLVSDASYVELFNSSTNTAYDLSGWRLNGLSYTFPPGSVITNGQYLVLAADQSAYISAYGIGNVPFGIYPGTLQLNGETLSLIEPAAATNLPDITVDKVKYSSVAPWPTNASSGASLQLKSAAQDNFRAGNWAAATGTPGSNNSVVVAVPAFPPLFLNELQADNLTGITNKAGQRTPWLELLNSGSNVVTLTNLYLSKTYTNLTNWAFPTNATINPGEFKIIFADGQTNLSTTNELHTSFTLPSGSGSVALSRSANSQVQVLDFVDYTNLTPNRSYGSFPDGQVFDRQEFFFVSAGATNIGTSAPLTVSINEWMAGNTHTLTNPVGGKFSDWFELYNYGTNPANLAGYYLTDTLSNQFQFQIPVGYVIPPHGFLTVWADSKPTNGTPELHTNFKMSKSGESLGLYGSDGSPVDFVTYGAQSDDVSEGRFPDGASTRYFMPTATPGTNNVIPNSAPVMDPVGNKSVHLGQTLHFTATATDAQSPPQILAFSLASGAPAGATIVPGTGSFTWTATNVAAPGTNTIGITVTDNGTPQLSNTVTFSVSVFPVPQFTGTQLNGSILSMFFSTLSGQSYQVQYKEAFSDAFWTPLNSPVNGNGGTQEIDEDVTGQTQRFYRILVMPMP